jgi:hypothetical protein
VLRERASDFSVDVLGFGSTAEAEAWFVQNNKDNLSHGFEGKQGGIAINVHPFATEAEAAVFISRVNGFHVETVAAGSEEDKPWHFGMTKAQLLDEAKGLGIESVTARTKNDEIIALIEAAKASKAEAESGAQTAAGEGAEDDDLDGKTFEELSEIVQSEGLVVNGDPEDLDDLKATIRVAREQKQSV